MSYYFAMMGTNDSPIYELEFGTFRQGGDGIARFPPEMRELNPFVVHSALDVVEDVQWASNQLYLKVVDNHYGYMISAMCTAGNIRFMLLHKSGSAGSASGPTGSSVVGSSGSSSGSGSLIGSSSSSSSASHNEEPIRQFFFDAYELYVKTLLSPFYSLNQPISSPIFDQKIRALAKKYL
ncbi:uncharacterized protein SAPINGB_P004950 [Magnusiomyces paraingens]|uniref:Trafficking protein particle complex subunit n=1 Tax=Magnusiomyces paraingens TaxID=2606893 RepID=A0A5E8C550_9ASCO|nr:uncharacterized protein SAPINGB_P004950 [Saprochaete ingens]VVT56306.1 unnamed protein product [Saprochaete ingens]